LTQAEWREVKATADHEGIAFFATVSFPEDIELLLELGCHSIKIASSDVSHHPLIRQAAKTGMCIQLDTGNSTIGEIEEAVDLILQEGNENFIIHQCPSGYPARLESINLRIIPTLKRMFQVPIAYSDHTPGWEMDVAAVALGANLVEKTITLDRTTRSVEHIFSLEPPEMKQFIQTIRDVETALGNTRRLMSETERQKRLATRSSCYYRRTVQAGEMLTEELIDYKLPGYGILPKDVEQLIGRYVRKDCPEGKQVEWTDLA
ncbi:MAG: N-acetylneuraminate synthase family protein, partial [Halothece sp. Uz-M2-17]|nr:N-acetylneuraminate synthase family protein [Halothece sp. Uz-M2-17]